MRYEIPNLIIDKIKKENAINSLSTIKIIINEYSVLLRKNKIKVSKLNADLDKIKRKLNKEKGKVKSAINFENYVCDILKYLIELNISQKHIDEIKLLKHKNQIFNYIKKEIPEIIIKLSENKFKPFYKTQKRKKTNNKNIIKSSEIELNQYVYLIIKYLKRIHISDFHTNKIAELKNKKDIEKYIKRNIPKSISSLKRNKIKPFYKEKSLYTKIIYTPMGNKR